MISLALGRDDISGSGPQILSLAQRKETGHCKKGMSFGRKLTQLQYYQILLKSVNI